LDSRLRLPRPFRVPLVSGAGARLAGGHGLGVTRYLPLTGLVYGADTEKYANLLGEEWLTEERAEQCPAEFERLSTSWYALLDPHLKE